LSPLCSEEGYGLRADYYSGTNFDSYIGTQLGMVVDQEWGNGSPLAGVTPDQFSVDWTGDVQVNSSGEHEFCVEADDGIRLWIDNRLIIDRWINQALTRSCGVIYLDSLVGGNFKPLQLHYFEASGDATVRLFFRSLPNGSSEIASRSVLYYFADPEDALIGQIAPFTARRLRDIARTYPDLIPWTNGIPPTYPGVQWNREMGVYFQGRMLALQGLLEYRDNMRSDERIAATFGQVSAVRPDGRADIILLIRNTEGVEVPTIFPSSDLVEVKATNAQISPSYRQYQFRGFFDVARSGQTDLVPLLMSGSSG